MSAHDQIDLAAKVQGQLSQPLDEQIKREEAALRQTLTRQVVVLFASANGFVFLIVLLGMLLDDINSNRANPSFARIIDANVIIAIVAGTTAQLGAIALVIAKYFFPSKG